MKNQTYDMTELKRSISTLRWDIAILQNKEVKAQKLLRLKELENMLKQLNIR